MLANLEVQTFHYKKWSSSCGTSLLLGAFCSPEIQKWIEFVMFLCWSRLKDCDHNINVISYVDTVQNCHGRFHCSSSFLFRCLGWITVILVATVRPPGWRSTSLLLLEVTKNEIAINCKYYKFTFVYFYRNSKIMDCKIFLFERDSRDVCQFNKICL